MMINIPLQQHAISSHLFKFSFIVIWSFLHIDIIRIFHIYFHVFFYAATIGSFLPLDLLSNYCLDDRTQQFLYMNFILSHLCNTFSVVSLSLLCHLQTMITISCFPSSCLTSSSCPVRLASTSKTGFKIVGHSYHPPHLNGDASDISLITVRLIFRTNILITR